MRRNLNVTFDFRSTMFVVGQQSSRKYTAVKVFIPQSKHSSLLVLLSITKNQFSTYKPQLLSEFRGIAAPAEQSTGGGGGGGGGGEF